MVCHIEQHEDNEQYDWNYDLQPLFGSNSIFVLATPLDVITRKHRDALGNDTFCFLDETAHVSATYIHQNGSAEQSVFACDHRRAHNDSGVGDLSERDLGAVRTGDENVS